MKINESQKRREEMKAGKIYIELGESVSKGRKQMQIAASTEGERKAMINFITVSIFPAILQLISKFNTYLKINNLLVIIIYIYSNNLLT